MLEQLKKVAIFTGLSDEALRLLLQRANGERFAKDKVVVSEGEPGTQFFLLISGTVRVVKGFGKPEETELARLDTGEFFGEMCLLETLPRSATVQAVTDAMLLRVPALAFYDLYREMPANYSLLMLNIARDLSRRLRRLDEVFAARST